MQAVNSAGKHEVLYRHTQQLLEQLLHRYTQQLLEQHESYQGQSNQTTTPHALMLRHAQVTASFDEMSAAQTMGQAILQTNPSHVPQMSR